MSRFQNKGRMVISGERERAISRRKLFPYIQKTVFSNELFVLSFATFHRENSVDSETFYYLGPILLRQFMLLCIWRYCDCDWLLLKATRLFKRIKMSQFKWPKNVEWKITEYLYFKSSPSPLFGQLIEAFQLLLFIKIWF